MLRHAPHVEPQLVGDGEQLLRVAVGGGQVAAALDVGEEAEPERRLAGRSAARITRALNDAGIPCPSAADPARNSHRAGTAWTLRTVAAILANPRYTGRQVWNRQRTDHDLVEPADTGLGHKQVQRWNLPEGWVISRRPAHPALVSEADFIAAQDATAPRGPSGPATRRYLLAGLLACGRYGRRLESAWCPVYAAHDDDHRRC